MRVGKMSLYSQFLGWLTLMLAILPLNGFLSPLSVSVKVPKGFHESNHRDKTHYKPMEVPPKHMLMMTTTDKQLDKPASILSADSPATLNALTLYRVAVPSLAAGVVAFLAFPPLCMLLTGMWRSPAVLTVLSQDSSQFVQNFLTVAGLLFSILVGQTYYFLYQQQEMVYYALFNEVTEAKSLLEQTALVCQGRSMYTKVLESIQRYVEQDLRMIQADPAKILSARPMDDPLETIMYLTSVGVPSTVYETVKSLRQARAQRLGALQRKLPAIHMSLLWMLGGMELVSFPLLGAGTQVIGGYNLLTVEGALFGVMTVGVAMILRVIGELWRPAGGAYQVDSVLKVMVRGLEQELEARLSGKRIKALTDIHPSRPPTLDRGAKKPASEGEQEEVVEIQTVVPIQ
eukprot:Nitzschia sp. Nitz4//scaffold237_size30108//21992//23257//NITZ4_007995-RA/size30108-augustus-gene-0.2-mRNA-1//-1//CDS//3329543515//3607//frame0